jgi:hypothetical protein
MKTWDASETRNSFTQIASRAEIYAKELATRIRCDPKRDSPFTRETHDEYLAKWFVYDSLSFSNSLRTKEALVAELKSRLNRPFTLRGEGRFSQEDFEKHWRRYMQDLLNEYEQAKP